MSDLVATVVIPTTGDRAAVLDLALASAQAQTVRDLEIFVMGDGVADATRALLAERTARDPRIRFFDHPKHARRGEPYRHAALAEARGRIVCYLTDRDLWLPHHVEVLAELLERADFAHTLRFAITKRGSPRLRRGIGAMAPESLPLRQRVEIPLSFAGHTLEMYRKLPYGWRETPAGTPTDAWMWAQFLREPGCRVVRGERATVLYFKRGDHPGWPVAKRRAELETWHARLQKPGFARRFARRVEVRASLPRPVKVLRRRLAQFLRSRGGPTLRSARATIRDVERASIQEGLDLEVYWVEPEEGPGASVYAWGEEVLRLDCFGGDRGHMHTNPHQARRYPLGLQARLFFQEGSIEEHVERARFELARNLAATLVVNRRRRIRGIRLDENALAEWAGWMQRRMLALLEARRSPEPAQ